MTWLMRQIVDLFNLLAAGYYRRKYGAAARRLGRSEPRQADDERGFIIIELDGLGYEYLREALREGQMPYLARLILGRKLRLARWRCGLPSTTPASQAGIMYGNNWDIPGFRWYDKSTHTSIVCKQPGTVGAIQNRIAAGRSGILRGGSSYTNMFDGDARLALFTLASLGREHLFENVRGLGVLVLFALSPVRIVKVIGMSLWTWFIYVVKRMGSVLLPGEYEFRFWGPLTEAFNNIIFREVTTFSVMVDIYRGMPAIYASYTGYDEIAHHFGANSREAFRALRGLDKQIRQIDRIRQVYVQRQYDLYVLSDHGMTPSTSFRRQFGQTLQEFIGGYTGQDVHGEAASDAAEGLSATRMRFLLEEIQALEARPHRPLPAQLLRLTRRRLEDLLHTEIVEPEYDLSRRGDIIVRNSGSLSHVYFNVSPSPMNLSELTLLYPALVGELAEHEGIGLVVGREGEDVVLIGRAGTLWLTPTGRRLEGQDPLGSLPDPEWAAAQVARVARFPHAGDLILLGVWDDNHVITFEEQVASHGGLGGGQDRPFIAVPYGRRLMARRIENAEEVYRHLAQIYGAYE
jgi:hypothetical protein